MTVALVLVVIAGASYADRPVPPPPAELPFELGIVDNSSDPDPNLAGCITRDLIIETDTDWLSAQLLLVLDEPGCIYQPYSIDVGPPRSPFPPPLPLFDTYVTDGQLGLPSVIGGAVDFGGGEGCTFDENTLDITWCSFNEDDIGRLVLARITLSGDAQGTWQFRATALPLLGPSVYVSGLVTNGYMPEPATLSLLVLGGVMLIRRRRRQP
jgi:hypothetical protein